jgi:6-phosphogluconolactonase
MRRWRASRRADNIDTYADRESLARAAGESFVRSARAAVEQRGRFSVALTGGSSPRLLYGLLAEHSYSERIPWDDVHLFWGDDRCVPPGHPRSNYGLAQRLFISRVPIPRQNVHRIRGELSPERAAATYTAELTAFFGSPFPRFDLIHLGLGDDAHIASLFPFDTPRLSERAVPAVPALRLPEGEPRVTLTLPAINAARRIEFLVPRLERKPIARSVMNGPLDPFRLPAQLVRPAGDLVWMVAP